MICEHGIGPCPVCQVEKLKQERDEALALLAETWEWTTPSVYGKLGYIDLQQRVRAALGAKEEPGSEPG